MDNKALVLPTGGMNAEINKEISIKLEQKPKYTTTIT